MKNLLIACSLLAFSYAGFAQSEKYTGAMEANIKTMDSAKTDEEFIDVSDAFESIGDVEKTQWLPFYYASLAQVTTAFIKMDLANGDQYADKAEALLNKADALEKNNSEISCLRAMIATLRMLVNPQQRWQQYGPVIEENIEKAKTQDPTNPRPYVLKGQNLRGTPEQFGGGCATAKPVLEEALKKIETFKPASSLHPIWGRRNVEMSLSTCK